MTAENDIYKQAIEIVRVIVQENVSKQRVLNDTQFKRLQQIIISQIIQFKTLKNPDATRKWCEFAISLFSCSSTHYHDSQLVKLNLVESLLMLGKYSEAFQKISNVVQTYKTTVSIIMAFKCALYTLSCKDVVKFAEELNQDLLAESNLDGGIFDIKSQELVRLLQFCHVAQESRLPIKHITDIVVSLLRIWIRKFIFYEGWRYNSLFETIYFEAPKDENNMNIRSNANFIAITCTFLYLLLPNILAVGELSDKMNSDGHTVPTENIDGDAILNFNSINNSTADSAALLLHRTFSQVSNSTDHSILGSLSGKKRKVEIESFKDVETISNQHPIQSSFDLDFLNAKLICSIEYLENQILDVMKSIPEILIFIRKNTSASLSDLERTIGNSEDIEWLVPFYIPDNIFILFYK